jgi:hypothetical protein
MTEPNPFLPGPSIDDGKVGPTFDEYRWSQLTERVQNLDGALAMLYSRVAALEDHREAHERGLDVLNRRLTDLEDAGKPATKPRDELNERIIAFLESHPNLKFPAISIDANLGGTGKDISDRLKTLAKNGRIRMFAEEKRRPFYQALEQPAPVEDQSTS